jgi:hypothetical protein
MVCQREPLLEVVPEERDGRTGGVTNVTEVVTEVPEGVTEVPEGVGTGVPLTPPPPWNAAPRRIERTRTAGAEGSRNGRESKAVAAM